MATYYVSKEGSNANNGLGPDASHASNKPWLTIDYALSTATTAGDIVYIGPGIYRETTVADASGSAGSPISFIGDPRNLQGFKTAAGAIVAASEVILTAWTTNDTTAPTATALLAIGVRNYLSFEKINFFHNAGRAVTASTANNITFTDCAFNDVNGGGSIQAFYINGITAGAAMSWVIDRCAFIGKYGGAIIQIANLDHTDDYDLDFIIRNCLFVGGYYAIYLSGLPATHAGGGLIVRSCTMLGSREGVYIAANLATQTFPSEITGCLICASTGIVSGHTAQQNEDYNIINSPTPRTNVTAGGNSISDGSRCAYIQFYDDFCTARNGFRLAGTLAPESKALNFGSAPSAPTVDLFNRPRPSGGAGTANAAGCFELHNYGVKETTVKDAGDASIKLTGPGDHEIRIPVDASATTISIKARFDSGTYGGANYPQAILLDASEIGVTTETETATVAASDAWETLTFTQFTPTAKGWVTIRLVNRGSGGDDICYFDTIAVT